MIGRYTPDQLSYFGGFDREPVRMHGDRGVYQVGSVGVPFDYSNTPRPCPTYLRGSLSFDLPEDMGFVTVPFAYEDGSEGVAIMLRRAEEELFGTSYPASQRDEAERMVALLNTKLDEQRAYFREREARSRSAARP